MLAVTQNVAGVLAVGEGVSRELFLYYSCL